MLKAKLQEFRRPNGGGRQKRKMRTMVAQMPLTVMRWSVY
jgi:hypothetical protein